MLHVMLHDFADGTKITHQLTLNEGWAQYNHVSPLNTELFPGWGHREKAEKFKPRRTEHAVAGPERRNGAATRS